MEQDESAPGRPRGRKPPPEAYRSATWIALILALWVSVLVLAFLRRVTPGDWPGWKVLLPLSAAGAWLGAWAWWKKRFWLAAPGFLFATVAPWGFVIFGPIIALCLSIASFVLAIRERTAARAQIEK